MRLTLKDFGQLLGARAESLPDECRDFFSKKDFRYKKVALPERDRIVLDILKRLELGTLSIAGKKRKPDWERGWRENLRAFSSSGAVAQLKPKYFNASRVVRLNGEFVLPRSASFEYSWHTAFRVWLFKRYFKKVDGIYDFGCGPAYNLILMRKLFPKKRLIGLDWTKSTLAIIKKLDEKTGGNMRGEYFNLFHPRQSFSLGKNSGVLTMGALEQIGTNFEPFLQYLLKVRPAICVHVEPVLEWYDENCLLDSLAIRFHQQRNYLRGFAPRLQSLDRIGKIDILKMKKIPFGSRYHDGFSLLVWRPRKKAVRAGK